MENTAEAIKIHLTQFLDFLLKEGYCDTDVYAEPPTAIDQYLAKYELPTQPGVSEFEIFEEARKVEDYRGTESDMVAAEKSGKFHGFKKGAKWMQSKLTP